VALETVRGCLVAADSLVLLLDYDGTLVPFADTPDLGRPDAALLALLARLAARARTETHVVSGRPRHPFGTWLASLPLWLHAEHGGWSRTPDGAWTAAPVPPLPWLEPARRILTEFAAGTPGALVEEKTAGLAWHYRLADPEQGVRQARRLKLRLSAAFGGEAVEILDGVKVIEVRPRGHHKGRVVPPILARVAWGSLLAALGDDRTDEDLFAALPPDAVAIHVGDAPSRAGLRVPSVAAARAFLEAVAAAP
jgi:trehalose 6-phosphate synthase/phosphatase